MNRKISTSLIISVYNGKAALEVVLKSLLLQVVLPDEIIFSDDGSDNQIRDIIDGFKNQVSIPVKYFWHPDKGFRKTIIMNKSIADAIGEYIIQIDGDIILHRHFIADHINEAKKGFYIKGSRSMLSPRYTQRILTNKNVNIFPLSSGVRNKINAMYLPLLSPIFMGNKFRSNNLKGCNFSFWLKDFIAVNGYNNEMGGWGHEDIELAARLTNLGIKQKQLKLKAVCFHLYHNVNSRHSESRNFNIYMSVVQNKIMRCKDGITMN